MFQLRTFLNNSLHFKHMIYYKIINQIVFPFKLFSYRYAIFCVCQTWHHEVKQRDAGRSGLPSLGGLVWSGGDSMGRGR